MSERSNVIDGGNRSSTKVWLARILAGIVAVGGLAALGDGFGKAAVAHTRSEQKAAEMYPMPTNHVPTDAEINKINVARHRLSLQLDNQDIAMTNGTNEGIAGVLGVIGGGVLLGVFEGDRRRRRPFLS